ncbi:unnamed protein product [Blepharisma stoltei]|uniref:Uncharacterized protein n=1 Tax=Blepharisma stoltei TaxID=1481888 RepID=A0AAU9K314_9CILI|nr:unnamed protein product [Blepharisma stoltei]
MFYTKDTTQNFGYYLLLWKLLVSIFILNFCNCLEIIVIYKKNSSIWSENFIFELSSDNNAFTGWHNCEYSEISICLNLYENAGLVLDLTESIETQFFISEMCKEREISHLVFENKLNYIDHWTFSIMPSSSDQIKSFIAYSNILVEKEALWSIMG